LDEISNSPVFDIFFNFNPISGNFREFFSTAEISISENGKILRLMKGSDILNGSD
jgi:hypothetical protein